MKLTKPQKPTVSPSPRPWKVVYDRDKTGWSGVCIVDANGMNIAKMIDCNAPPEEQQFADAHFIVKSVNGVSGLLFD